MRERQPTREDSDSEPEDYRYIVPSGVRVVFRDHDGKEIARYVSFAKTTIFVPTVGIGLVTQGRYRPGGDLEI